MSTKVSRKSQSTVLTIGSAATSIDLFKAIADPRKARRWEVREPEPEEPLEYRVAPREKGTKFAVEYRANPNETWDTEPFRFDSEGDAQLYIDKQRAEEGEPERGDPLGGAHAHVHLDGDPGSEAPPPAEGGAPMGGAVPAGSASTGAAAPPPPEPAEPRKGILKGDGAFVDLTDHIESIAERSKLERAEVVSFIDGRHVPRERIIATYYVGAGTGEGLPATRLLKVLAEAMRTTRKVAVVRFSKRKGQSVGIITPRRDGALLLLELCFAEQFREPNGKCLAHTQAQVNEKEIEAAGQLIEAMADRRSSLDSIGDLRNAMEEELVTRAEAGELDDYVLPDADPAADGDTALLGDLLKTATAA